MNHAPGVKLGMVELKVEGSRGSSSGCPSATKEAPVTRVFRTGCSFVQPGQPLELPLLRPTVLHLTPGGRDESRPYDRHGWACPSQENSNETRWESVGGRASAAA